ncbi:MAG TPA: PQQ-binding-like beta-propeller repeat protein [Candidatus Acidoferrum sp.]
MDSTATLSLRIIPIYTPYRVGTFVPGGGEDELPPDDAWGAIKALQAESGELRWEFKLHSPPWAGVLPTAGGLVFSGSDEGNFYALDARTGKPLWDFQTGGAIGANPVSFIIDGRRCIAIAADRVLYVSASEWSKDSSTVLSVTLCL